MPIPDYQDFMLPLLEALSDGKEHRMTDLKAEFEAAARDALQLPSRPDNDTLLQLYALYKQSTVGDVTGKRPGLLAMVDRAKHDAWAKLSGTPKDSAMQRYVALVTRLKSGK